MPERKRGFTLIEILLALALTGMLVALALAPVIYAVRQVVDTQAAYSDEIALRRTATFMAQDVAAGLRLAPVTFKTEPHRQLGGGSDDTLIVAGSAPAKQNMAAGSVVYKVVRGRFMNASAVPGLYRWVLPGVMPGDVDTAKLEEKDARLVAPYITELEVSAFSPPDWVDEYSGKIPRGMRITLAREEERVEYVFSFPR